MCIIASELSRLRQTIIREVFEAMKKVEITGGYAIAWREYERAAILEIERILIANTKLLGSNFDSGVRGSDKNRLADLAIVCNEGTTAISIKAARAYKNPANDLGTFRGYAKKKALFKDTFELWVSYDDRVDKGIRIEAVFFDEAYKFVGIYRGTRGVGYRKNDGNLRPKPWKMFENDTSFWNTPAEFDAAFEVSRIYRANSLVQEYLVDLSEDDQRIVYDSLKKKFEG